jgi:hypothetical protein
MRMLFSNQSDSKFFRIYIHLLSYWVVIMSTSSLGMFTSSLRRAGQSSVPTYVARTAYQYSVGSPLASRYITQPTPSWRSRTGTALNNWRQQRSYHSLNELFAVKTAEEHAKHLQELAQKGTPLSPTQAHITHSEQFAKKNARMLRTPLGLWKEVDLRNVDLTHIDTIIEQEKRFFDAGYHVVYHSTTPLYYALHYIDTLLETLHKKLIEHRHIPENIPLRLRQQIADQAEERDQKQIQQKLMTEGSKKDHKDRQYLLACNPTMTSNFSYSAECSLEFWDDKWSVHEISFNHFETSLSAIATRSPKLSTFIKPYIQEITESVRLLNHNLKTGVLLQLVFKDSKLVEECLYPSKPYGIKRSVCIDGTETSNVLAIMHAFSAPKPKLSPQAINELQYRLVVTSESLLDVFNKKIYENFEIHAYANPQSALESFHQKIKRIMHQIEHDFNKWTTSEQPMSKESEL